MGARVEALSLTIVAFLAAIALLHPDRFSPMNFRQVSPESPSNLLQDDYSPAAFKQKLPKLCEVDFEELERYNHDQSLFQGDQETEKDDGTAHHSWIVAKSLNISQGGTWKPPKCTPRHKSVLLVPYRDRPEHLEKFLLLLHPFLQAQKLNYAVVVVEQEGGAQFNRAKLFNVGFSEAVAAGMVGLGTCLIFHDVDLIPMDGRNLYACARANPRHLSTNIDVFRYNLIYGDSFGGVSAVSAAMFREVNGYSNEFYGWGGEDDDFSDRLRYRGYDIVRFGPPAAEIGRYRTLPHPSQERRSGENARHLQEAKRARRRNKKTKVYEDDGLGNLNYTVVERIRTPLHYHVKVAL